MNSQGQTLTEFIASIGLVVLAILGSASLFQAEWHRAQCAYLVFETTHAQLTGRKPPFSQVHVQILESDNDFTGEARCGQARERVSLPKLENAEW